MADENERTESRTGGRTLVYDGDCPLCEATTAWLAAWGVLAPTDRVPLQQREDADRLLAAGGANEILAVEPDTGAVHTGLHAIAYVLGPSKFGGLMRLLTSKALLPITGAVYGFIAANRRFLSPPAVRAVQCACEPEPRPARQLALIAIATTMFLGVLLALGVGAPPELRLVGSRLGLMGAVVKGAWPWSLLVLLAGTMDRSIRLPYLTHVAATAGIGAIALLPLAIAGLAAPAVVDQAFETLLQLSAVAAGLWMFASHRRRIAFLGLGRGWLIGWTCAAGFGLFTLGWLRTLG